jgi:hypothetical protein
VNDARCSGVTFPSTRRRFSGLGSRREVAIGACLRFGGRMCSRFVSAGGSRGSPVIQEAISDDFSARKDGDRGGDVAMVGGMGRW